MLHHQAGRAGEFEDDAHEAVDGDFGHHAAHQRGDVARRRRMRERQPDVQRHDAGLRAGADQSEDQHQRAERGGWMRGAHLRERVKAVGAGEQAEGEQQSERAEARHDQIDVAGAHVLGHAMVRHHQRPRRQRHELPGQQKREGVVGEHDQRHAGKERRIERQHASGRRFVLAVAERKQARAKRAEIDHDQEKGRERIEAQMRAEPGQAERQREADRGRRRRAGAQRRRRAKPPQRPSSRHRRDASPRARRPIVTASGRERQQRRSAGEDDRQRHDAALLSRTPRPPPWLVGVVGNQLDAERIERSDELHQRIDIAADDAFACLHALDGRQRQPGRFGELRWSMPRSAREARSCPAVIIE